MGERNADSVGSTGNNSPRGHICCASLCHLSSTINKVQAASTQRRAPALARAFPSSARDRPGLHGFTMMRAGPFTLPRSDQRIRHLIQSDGRAKHRAYVQASRADGLERLVPIGSSTAPLRTGRSGLCAWPPACAGVRPLAGHQPRKSPVPRSHPLKIESSTPGIPTHSKTTQPGGLTMDNISLVDPADPPATSRQAW